MSTFNVDESRLEDVVVERAREFGHDIRADDVALDVLEEEVAPGCWVFRASYGSGEVDGAVSGLLEDGEPPDTWPQRSLSKVFRRWLDADGRVSDPLLAAKAAAYLYDPAGMNEVILTDSDADRLVTNPQLRRAVALPHVTTTGSAPSLVFSWVRGNDLSEIQFHLDAEDEVWSSEKRL